MALIVSELEAINLLLAANWFSLADDFCLDGLPESPLTNSSWPIWLLAGIWRWLALSICRLLPENSCCCCCCCSWLRCWLLFEPVVGDGGVVVNFLPSLNHSICKMVFWASGFAATLQRNTNWSPCSIESLSRYSERFALCLFSAPFSASFAHFAALGEEDKSASSQAKGATEWLFI